ncbi:hypothetical protein BAQ46_23570 [Bacillus paranthracis]|nr:hypothetical protein BAQ46_23570 [Bacillus paranthracis]SMD83442.1 hypothetical protein BACERE00195_01387 [Bacillus cereus]
MKKILKNSLIALVLTITSLGISAAKIVQAETTGLKGLGDATKYNAVIFGDHSANSGDIEGAIAIQGNMDASS